MPICLIPSVGHENTLLAVGLKQAGAEHKQIKWLRQRSNQAWTASCSDPHRLLRQLNQLNISRERNDLVQTTSMFRINPLLLRCTLAPKLKWKYACKEVIRLAKRTQPPQGLNIKMIA